MELFSLKAYDPKRNAQQNLCGRTHYVDKDTLRFHKSRIVYSDFFRHGLLFAIVTSDALDYNNTKRGFRFVIFDLFGNVIARTELEKAFRRSEQAKKAMSEALRNIDAANVNYSAMDRAKLQFADEMTRALDTISKIEIAEVKQAAE